ncbi:MAG: protein-disulfide reductase DsbD family protein [Gammaproteobacteria bacterium]|nr:protein-disulfide reductase DsbD family protein [Gammaproteobacteria bacterium]
MNPRRQRNSPFPAAALAAAALLATAGVPVSASPDLIRVVKTEHVVATLAPAVAVVSPGAIFPVALHQKIRTGWHTYWENPGDSGQRIDIQWTLPAGVTAGALRYPVPKTIPVGPLMNFGYTGEAAVLADIAVSADWPAGRPLELSAHATWLVCEEICIPEEARFTLSLPTGPDTVVLEPVRELFARAEAALPRPAPWPVTVRDAGDHLILGLGAPLGPEAVGHSHFFPRHWGHLDHAAPQKTQSSGTGIEWILPKGDLPPAGVLEGVLALGGGQNAGYLISAAVRTDGADAAPPSSKRPAAKGLAEPYDPARLDAILAAGGAVLLNVTADWCVICKMNERSALTGDRFRQALETHGVTYMTGDWTDRDPRLTALLERFGRAGVPLYVYFPGGGAEPKVLPQVLTESIVADTLAGG